MKYCCDNFAWFQDVKDGPCFYQHDGEVTFRTTDSRFEMDGIHFCPFCGKRIDGKEPHQTLPKDIQELASRSRMVNQVINGLDQQMKDAIEKSGGKVKVKITCEGRSVVEKVTITATPNEPWIKIPVEENVK
jgi:hypothetical protein